MQAQMNQACLALLLATEERSRLLDAWEDSSSRAILDLNSQQGGTTSKVLRGSGAVRGA